MTKFQTKFKLSNAFKVRFEKSIYDENQKSNNTKDNTIVSHKVKRMIIVDI